MYFTSYRIITLYIVICDRLFHKITNSLPLVLVLLSSYHIIRIIVIIKHIVTLPSRWNGTKLSHYPKGVSF